MKNGRCVKSGTLCVDCWPSVINPSCCGNHQPIRAMPVSVPDVSDSTDSQLRSQSSTSPSNNFHENC